MQTKKISTIFLDIGGILLTDGWGRRQREEVILKLGLDKDETEDRNALVWDTYELDKLTLDDYLNFVIFHVERPFSKEEFKALMMEQSQPLDGAIEYFKELKKEHGYKIVALSNEARELNAFRIKKFKLDELYDFYLSSCYVRLRKPDPAIFKLALDTAQVLPGQSVYIDDRLTYIEIASKLGLPSLHYQSLDSAKEYFKNLHTNKA
jgi:putative hydrolase of the HAD superfamily